MKKVVIVVPTYKETLEYVEQVSLCQLQRVLGAYPKVFIAPEGLKINYNGLEKGFSTEFFDKDYFSSIPGYSQLCLSKELYERFSDYDYMLLCQLDAFVFNDRLMEFVNKGYDYIGAPVYRYVPYWHAFGTNVGNGGFSLRKISSCIKMLAKAPSWLPDDPFSDVINTTEDMFFACCGMKKELDFKIPKQKEALEFAIQDNVAHAYERFNELKPFACHGWYKADCRFFLKLITESYGYDLSGVIYGGARSFQQKYDAYYSIIRKYINIPRLYYYLKHDKPYGAIALMARTLEKYSEPLIYSGLLEDFNSLWRLCIIKLKETNDDAYLILEQLIQQILLKSLESGGYHGTWNVGWIKSLYLNVAKENTNRCNIALWHQLDAILSQDQKSMAMWDFLQETLFFLDHDKNIESETNLALRICIKNNIPGDKFISFVNERTQNPAKVVEYLMKKV